MASERVTATAAELVRQFAHYSDVALNEPVVVTKNGRPRHVLVSVAEYERLRQRDQLAFAASETPDQFIGALEALAKDA